MYEDHDEFDDYENFDNSQEIRDAAERAREAMIVRAIEVNYDKLMSKGFSANNIMQWSYKEKEEVIETLNFMLNHFEKIEEYEKCANLVKARECLINEETFAPVL